MKGRWVSPLLIGALIAGVPVVSMAQGESQAQIDKAQIDQAHIDKAEIDKAEIDKAQIDKGRAVVAQVCTTCHTTLGRMLQVHKQTPEQWKDLVYFMISRGAQVMPNEIDAVAAFLSATAGKDPRK